MSDPTGLVTEERMERMIRVIAESPDSCEIGEQDGVLASELRALITTARLALALREEVLMWRRKAGKYETPETITTDALCAKLGVRIEVER